MNTTMTPLFYAGFELGLKEDGLSKEAIFGRIRSGLGNALDKGDDLIMGTMARGMMSDNKAARWTAEKALSTFGEYTRRGAANPALESALWSGKGLLGSTAVSATEAALDLAVRNPQVIARGAARAGRGASNVMNAAASGINSATRQAPANIMRPAGISRQASPEYMARMRQMGQLARGPSF